jgi:hypothetical protein
VLLYNDIIRREIFMAEATRIRGLFEASRFAWTARIFPFRFFTAHHADIRPLAPCFSYSPTGTPRMARRSSKLERFISRSASSSILINRLPVLFCEPGLRALHFPAN